MRNSILWGIPVGLIMLVSRNETRAQLQATGARSSALAGISAGLEEVWAVGNNPAGLARLEAISLATSLEQRYLMKELGSYGAALTLPAGNGCLGVLTSFSGYRSWIEQRCFLGYGMAFGEKFLAGISLMYDYQRAGNESPSLHQVSYGLGSIVIISPRINLSFSTFNPFQLYYRSREYASLPSVFRLGLAYCYSDSFTLYSELSKDLDLPPEFRIASEYKLREVFFIRCGIGFPPFTWSFGTAVRHNRYLFELAASYDQYLGFTPVVTLQFDIR